MIAGYRNCSQPGAPYSAIIVTFWSTFHGHNASMHTATAAQS